MFVPIGIRKTKWKPLQILTFSAHAQFFHETPSSTLSAFWALDIKRNHGITQGRFCGLFLYITQPREKNFFQTTLRVFGDYSFSPNLPSPPSTHDLDPRSFLFPKQRQASRQIVVVTAGFLRGFGVRCSFPVHGWKFAATFWRPQKKKIDLKRANKCKAQSSWDFLGGVTRVWTFLPILSKSFC